MIWLIFLKWKFIDLYRFFTVKDKPIRLYGLRCVAGMYGHGKTTTLSYFGYNYRKKYGNKVYITSNYGFALQDFPFNNINILTNDYDKPIIYLWDEVQNDFPSTDKNFPKAVRQSLTLCRHGNGKMIFWCSQDHELVHKTIRRLTIEYYLIRTFMHRLTFGKVYTALDYELMTDKNDVEKRHKIRPKSKFKFVQTDELRNTFSSFKLDNGELLEK